MTAGFFFMAAVYLETELRDKGRRLNQTTGHWYSVKLFENTPTVRSERSRASGEVEEQAGHESESLRLRSATLRPNGQGSTASEEASESSVVRFRLSHAKSSIKKGF